VSVVERERREEEQENGAVNVGLVSGRGMLCIVELHFRGLNVAVSRSPEEHILSTVYRLSAEEKNKLSALKVKFYRLLDRYSVFRIGEKYVVSYDKLPVIEKEFKGIRADFLKLRAEIYENLRKNWPVLSEKLKRFAEKYDIPPERIERLAPPDEQDLLLDMNYTILPLHLAITQMYATAEEFEKMSKKVEEYKDLADRLRRNAEEMVKQVRGEYEKKIKELENTIEKLKEAIKTQSKEIYRLRVRAKELINETESISTILGKSEEEEIEELKTKLQVLQEYVTN
jgi:DNA repair exonuclease SbcCD ATPase subunit